jgi:hypothetical protein
MAKIRRFNESKVGREADAGTKTGDLRSSQPIAGGARFCAYNLTRERFLSNQIEVGSFSMHFLEERLASFAPGLGFALWVNPFRELPLSLFRSPVDLVYLNQSCVVLDKLESFPISTPGSSMEMAASVLVLPARTIATIGINHGDQLILCNSDEMELRLAQLQSENVQSSTGPEIIQNRSVASFARFSVHEDLIDKGSSNSLKPQEDLIQSTREEISPAEETPGLPSIPDDETPLHDDEPVSTGYVKKSWWRRFLAGEPPDLRKGERESIPGLVAYFFTGGAPIAHKVRDISATGLYVLTDERWYPNTALRITLSDERDPDRQVSITLFARVARSGSDGVGMQFGLVRKKDLNENKSSHTADQALIVTKEQVEDFVRRFKASS